MWGMIWLCGWSGMGGVQAGMGGLAWMGVCCV